MKQLKFLMAALLMVMGVSLSSCLDSGDNTTRVDGAIVKVNSRYGTPIFYMLNGRTIALSSASLNSNLANGIDFNKFDGQILQFEYTWDSSLIEITDDTKDIKDVAFYRCFPMNSAVEVVTEDGAKNDSISDMPIISLKKEISGHKYEPYFWGKTLVLPIEYYMSTRVHNFTLEYHPEQQESDGTLKLVLEHNKVNDQISYDLNTSWDFAVGGAQYAYYRAFDLTNILYMLDTTPENVIVEYKESTQTDLDKAESKTCTIPYKDAFEK